MHLNNFIIQLIKMHLHLFKTLITKQNYLLVDGNGNCYYVFIRLRVVSLYYNLFRYLQRANALILINSAFTQYSTRHSCPYFERDHFHW